MLDIYIYGNGMLKSGIEINAVNVDVLEKNDEKELINATRTLRNEDVDDVTGKILKYVCGFLKKRLCGLFNISVKTASVAVSWKNAVIVPL